MTHNECLYILVIIMYNVRNLELFHHVYSTPTSFWLDSGQEALASTRVVVVLAEHHSDGTVRQGQQFGHLKREVHFTELV